MESGQTSHFCSVYCGSERFHCMDGLVDVERWTINVERWTMNDEPLLNPPLKGRTFVRWTLSVERWKSSPFTPDKISLLFTCSLVHLFTHLLCINIFLICYFSYNIYYIYIIAQIHKCVNSEQVNKWTPQDFNVTAW